MQSFFKSVRNPKVWIFVFEFDWTLDFGGPRKITSRGGMMAGEGGRVKIFNCYRRPCRCCGCGCDWRLWLWSASSILSCVRLHGLETHGHNMSQRTSIVRFSPRLCHRINSKAFQKRAQPNVPVAQNQNILSHLVIRQLRCFGPRGFQNIPFQ